MSNPFKLVLVMLLFFLALTFVRGFTAIAPQHEVTFLGNTPVPFVVSVSNSASGELKPSFLADGPFSIVFTDEPSDLVVAGHSTQDFTLYLIPAPEFRVGDAYTAQIRVASANDEDVIPLALTKKEAPLFSGASGVVSGFVTSATGAVNAVLLVIILVLVIALIARIKNRVVGGKTQ